MPTGTQAQTAPQPTAQLTKVFVATDYAGYGQFDYKIKWLLTSQLQVNAVVLQKIEVSYSVKDEHDNPINISTYTDNGCTWHTHGVYWEAWFIRANELRPTYSAGNPKVPSFDASATIDNEWDDNYQTGTICDRRSDPNSDVKGITKGWVRLHRQGGTLPGRRSPSLESELGKPVPGL